jgi:vacuolar-type H+-ATPase subunit E/Vma4
MTATDPEIVAALAPVREALLAAARSDAERTIARAAAAAEQTVAAAGTAAARIREEARAQGVASGTAAASGERRRARRAARAGVLRAERDGYQRLRRAARRAVAQLPREPDYPVLRRRLAASITRALGPDAELRDGIDGGVIGLVPGRRVDYSLGRFADRAVDEVAGRQDEP